MTASERPAIPPAQASGDVAPQAAPDPQTLRALWHAELVTASAEDDDYVEDDEDRDTTCRHCSGTGGDPWNDGILPCEHCGGEGYEWWA